jgi:hypothetical protein
MLLAPVKRMKHLLQTTLPTMCLSSTPAILAGEVAIAVPLVCANARSCAASDTTCATFACGGEADKAIPTTRPTPTSPAQVNGLSETPF